MQEIETYIGTEYNMEPDRPKFADYYEILGDDNDGGMGEVYFCKDKRSGQLYALKKAKAEAKYEDLFKKEAAFALELGKHPNIVYTTTIGHKGDMYYIVMELIGEQNTISPQGNTLVSEFNKSPNGIPVEQAYKWAIEFCEGMKYLTSKGMKAHKDIKPANIFITKDKTLKIGDFGLAGTNPQKATGTPGYRAPEVKQGIFNEQTDIYSFGIVLYQLFNKGYSLTDATRYTQAGTEMLGKGEDSYPNAEEITSPYAQDIIRKCLQQDPQKRYQTFAELEGYLIQELQTLNPQYKFIPTQEESLNAEEYFNKGDGWNKLNICRKAVSYYNLGLKIKPNDIAAYNNRGIGKDELKDYAGAIADYNKAIELDPQNAHAYNNRGLAKTSLNDFIGALSDYNKAIELDPLNAVFYYNRGNLKCDLKNYSTSIDDYNMSIKLFPKNAQAYHNRGTVKYALQDYIGAITDYSKSIEIIPTYMAYYNRGNAKKYLKCYREAITDYNKALELNLQYYMAYYMRANTKYQIAEYIEAIEDYSKAIEVNSQYTYAYNNRGVTKEILKDYMGAIADYNKAIELDPKCTTAYNNLIALYGALNNPEKAEEIRKLKQKIVPKINN